jgi:RHS repeat-associated protein
VVGRRSHLSARSVPRGYPPVPVLKTAKHYNYFRDYDPAIGRYVESDPIGLFGGLNTFGYVGGNPLRRTDPSGRAWGLWCGTPIGQSNPDCYNPDKPPPPRPPIWPGNNWWGNWCGPGGGGQTVGSLDCACKKHDKCYENCGVNANTRWGANAIASPCALLCDLKLIGNAGSGGSDDCHACKNR